MRKKANSFIILSSVLFISMLRASSLETTLDNWPCSYLDPETVRRINPREVHTIVEVGSSNGLNAVRLSKYYKCPVFIFEADSKQLQTIEPFAKSSINENIAPYPQVTQISLQKWTLQLGEWMQQINIANVDLLCVDVPTSLQVFKNFGEHLRNVKYIIICKDSLTHESKQYLAAEGFQSFFDDVSIFNTVLFVRKVFSCDSMVNSNDLQKFSTSELLSFNTPILDPLIVGDNHSELIHAAFTNNHDAFHSVYSQKSLDINYQDSHGNTALITAASRNASYPLIKLLQISSTDCSIKNENGCTALMVAAATGSADTLLALLRDPRGFATIDIPNNLGMTAEETARLNHHSEIADLIQVRIFNTPVLEPSTMNNKNFDVNYQDAYGNTSLIIAASCNNRVLLQELLQLPTTDCSLQNKNGCTALMIAAAFNYIDIVNDLLADSRGAATIDMRNNIGMDAEEIARLSCSQEIVKLLNFKRDGNSSKEYLKHIIPEKILICGICKDVVFFLPNTIKTIENIGGLFDDYKVIVYENDSTDGTQTMLRQWSDANGNVDITCEKTDRQQLVNEVINSDDNKNPFRIELIAKARNILLDKIMSDQYDEYSYVIMIDMDFTYLPRADGIIEVFRSKREWDAVFSYGVGQTNTYWDWYAFRDFNQPLGPELLGCDWFGPKRWSLHKNDEWCPVYSAFGGCGIYKRESIRGCRYSSTVTSDLEKVAKRIIDSGKASNHPVIEKYLMDTQHLNQKINIFSMHTNLPRITDQTVGIVLNEDPQALVWRMNSFVYQYPVVCEHVPFHASMAERGHGKLFINPRLVFRYER